MNNNYLFKLTIGSHFFKITKMTPRINALMDTFGYKFVKYGIVRQPSGRFIREMVCVFAAATADRTEYRFHINALNDFYNLLKEKMITPTLYEVVKIPIPESFPLDLKLKDNWIAKEDQIPAIEYLDDVQGPVAKFIGIQTGFGKGFVSIDSMCRFNKRVIAIIKPMYLEKWFKELKQLTNATDKDMVIVRGAGSLMSLLEMARTGELKANFILISNVTFREYIKEYEKNREAMLDSGYACVPEDLYMHLKAGVRLVDEIHQDLHLNMKIDLYTNVERSISLSATLLSDDPFIQKMQELMYPHTARFKGGPLVKYIDATAYLYHINSKRHYRTQEYGSPNYSHMALEKSIMKNKEFMLSYFALIKTITDEYYYNTKLPGEKYAIFVSSVNMATELTKYLNREYRSLKVKRYCEDDPYENLLEPDIRVTTIISAGTAHDINNLVGVLLTTSIDSIQANIQVLGRLRRLPDKTPRFTYMSCMDIPKHMQFHERKIRMLNERARHLRIVLARNSV